MQLGDKVSYELFFNLSAWIHLDLVDFKSVGQLRCGKQDELLLWMCVCLWWFKLQTLNEAMSDADLFDWLICLVN